MEARAPGVIKLFGEHAVVYDRLAVAMAIDKYAYANVGKAAGEFSVGLLDFGRSGNFSEKELESIYISYFAKDSIPDQKGKTEHILKFIGENSAVDADLLPFAVIASRIHKQYGAGLNGIKAEIRSEIPTQKGFASSASCYTAFTLAMLNYLGISLGHDEIIEIAKDGERVRHKNEGAGKIDVSTSYYGGFVSYRGSSGAKKENDINTNIVLHAIDTGPKKSTAEMVGRVREIYESNREYANYLLDRIEACSTRGIAALKSDDAESLGKIMDENHSYLRMLGVSSESLEDAIALTKAAGGLGAKLSGGGGGGIAIAITKDHDALEKELALHGYVNYSVGVSKSGASVN
ncbi:MAG: mevalonate kinase [Candidatus Micrarchaeales archaeon]|nr:mevalonate kinase [Candidatus Micrarchaeales archaeon]